MIGEPLICEKCKCAPCECAITVDTERRDPAESGSMQRLARRLEIARVLLMHAVGGVLDGCGNSYSNAYTEKWLRSAKELGAYHGRVIGTINDLEAEWEEWLEENGLPDLPEPPSHKSGNACSRRERRRRRSGAPGTRS